MKTRIYLVSARFWNDEFQKEFGPDPKKVFTLSDEEVVNYIIRFGRASIDLNKGGEIGKLLFEND